MRIERTEHLGAGPHERTESRDGYANGFNPKTIRTQLGETTRRVTAIMEKLCGSRLLLRKSSVPMPSSNGVPWQRCQFHL